jgi:malate dehydrogenase (oxaloacetate-decarboxylating)(NADP+)
MRKKAQLQDLTRYGALDLPSGSALLASPLLNKGTAFTADERERLGLTGLLPPRIFTIEEQLQRVLGNLRRKPNNLEKFVFLTTLQNRNETLFYRLLVSSLEETMPLVYTPTVGEACLEYSAIFRRPRGIFLTAEDRGNVKRILANWPQRHARLIVVTDGERILGLGDLGALGMGIAVGKLTLYTACAGIHPYYCLPVTLDVGTDNERLLADPLYIGRPHRRLRGAEYDDFVREFVSGVQETFPGALIQFEDFGNANAFRHLATYRDEVPCFNDDIQGTAAVAVAGLLGALRLTGRGLGDQRLLFLGAGEAGTGIGELYVAAAQEAGVSEAEARSRCWYVDSKGLVVKSRTDLAHHKRPFAQDHAGVADFAAAVRAIRPTAIIGVSGMPQTFTPPILAEMAAINERPIVFALSNPTSKAECTAEEAYRHTAGRAIFASGSPFAPVQLDGRTFVPGQGNNVYVFPGVGLGALVFGARRVTDAMFLAAAHVVADEVTDADLAVGRVYPALSRIREVSAKIAVAVGEVAYAANLATVPRPGDLLEYVTERMFEPDYVDFV